MGAKWRQREIRGGAPEPVRLPRQGLGIDGRQRGLHRGERRSHLVQKRPDDRGGLFRPDIIDVRGQGSRGCRTAVRRRPRPAETPSNSASARGDSGLYRMWSTLSSARIAELSSIRCAVSAAIGGAGAIAARIAAAASPPDMSGRSRSIRMKSTPVCAWRDPLGAGLGLQRRASQSFEVAPRDHAVHRLVFHHQNPPSEPGRDHGLARPHHLSRVAFGQGHGQREPRPGARRAFQRQCAAHRLGQPPADREPEPQPLDRVAGMARAAHVDVEDPRLILRGDADAGIGDREAQHLGAADQGRARGRGRASPDRPRCISPRSRAGSPRPAGSCADRREAPAGRPAPCRSRRPVPSPAHWRADTPQAAP